MFPGRPVATAAAVAQGKERARTLSVGRCTYLDEYGVSSETEYKRRAVADGRIMLHGQIGWRDPAKSRRGWREFYEAIDKAGGRLDRYGICLDWSMGYPAAMREGRPKGTGLILDGPDDFAALTAEAPVAPHFGDFVLGMPAAVENTEAALYAGATSIGNMGQYFTFRMPGWDDDLATTEATVEALALIAAQPVEIIVHSNLDDGFAPLFADMACSLGGALLERYIVEDLLGGYIGHCYGHTFSEPLTRLAFQRALAAGREDRPGTMVYGNTVLYDGSGPENYAALASYLMVDIVAQQLLPSGHAVNPVPITEAVRIPDIDEAIEAALLALRLIERAEEFAGIVDVVAADRVAAKLLHGGEIFRDRVLAGLAEAGFDTKDAGEVMLALRRIGPKTLERLFGPGAKDPGQLNGRAPTVPATAIRALERAADKLVARIDAGEREEISAAELSVCLSATDVHEYGKILIGETLARLGVSVIDAGVHAEPDDVAALARDRGADFVAVSTYNGVALGYLKALQRALMAADVKAPVLIGGRLNQLPEASNTSLPVDVSERLAETGAVVCNRAEDMFTPLLEAARGKAGAA